MAATLSPVLHLEGHLAGARARRSRRASPNWSGSRRRPCHAEVAARRATTARTTQRRRGSRAALAPPRRAGGSPPAESSRRRRRPGRRPCPVGCRVIGPPRRARRARPPMARSVSSACCRISTAAAWSTTARRCPALATPVAQHSLRRPWSAARRTAARAPGATRRARRRGELADLHGRRALAAGQRPRQADHHLAPPLARRPGSRRSGPGRPCPGAPSRPASRGARTGRCARRRSGRARGRCRPVRRAARLSLPVTARATSVGTSGERLVDPGRVGAAALGDVVLAATAAADERPDARAPARRP